ncbi:phosphomannomutase/phosphoglucomutase [Rhodospirillaceae bacterium]|nr:phosphomannomutase/phosphoglucomutase [Alphaproteobacteria bacterium]MDC1441773.1 phosphomannomutase/phosphoglucomutase [Rhodospirillaceae bacterium]
MANNHHFHSSLLREYDIRGIVDETLFEEDARIIGRIFGTRIIANKGQSVAVGRDGRHSSLKMEQALIEGLKSTGLNVYAIGQCPTPQLYFAVHELKTGGGIMITGSHNPPSYNGFKMMLGTSPFFGSDIQNMSKLAKNGDYTIGSGKITEVNIFPDYIDRLLFNADLKKRLSIVWDCGNGSAGPAVEALCARLPGEHRILFSDVDGDFPNHHPDPTVEKNLETLIFTIQEEQADLGIAFDGDGDRIGVVDGDGKIVWGDQLLAILAEDVLSERNGATIIGDVKASNVLFDRISQLGGKPLMWKTGHSLIKTKMNEVNAPLAGEMSGHIFFRDKYYGFDDALYAAVRLIELLNKRNDSLSSIKSRLPKMVNTPELRFDCSEDEKFLAVEKAKNYLKTRENISVSTIDGIRVSDARGWWLLRASNTQAALVARCEADTLENLHYIKKELKDLLFNIGISAPEF